MSMQGKLTTFALVASQQTSRGARVMVALAQSNPTSRQGLSSISTMQLSSCAVVVVASTMVKFSVFFGALLLSSANAFVPTTNVASSAIPRHAATISSPEVDSIGNNIAVKNLLLKVESSGLLTQVAQSGLLSKAQAAGVSLTKLEPLLDLAASNPDVLILVEASGPELLPLLPKIVELAPGVLPLAGAAIGINPGLLQVGALASLVAAAGVVAYVPDDTVVNVAIQTLAAATLGVAVPAASLIGATVLKTITK